MAYPLTEINRPLGKTQRTDVWWLPPLGVAFGLGVFVVYTTWAGLQNAHYLYTGGGADYLSPLYSPLFSSTLFPDWWPKILASPAVLVLWAPAGFRLTCYYYRKAYYRAYGANPVACAVGKGTVSTNYRGETKLPFILQNVHRYFLYLALIFVVILSLDAIRSFRFEDGHGGHVFGMGLGSLVLTINPILIAGYTFGCHSLRHLVGGKVDCWSCSLTTRCRHSLWKQVSMFNERHQLWAWLSLVWVGFADLYVRMLAMGIWTDVRMF